MTYDDIPLVMSIENEAFPSVWPSTELNHELQNNKLASYLVSTTENNSLITGFIGLWFLLDAAHIIMIAVKESLRRQGIGELLLIAGIELTCKHNQDLLTLECRVSNHAAINLYEKYKFKQMGVRPGYYSDNREDAYILTSEKLRSESFQKQFKQLKQNYNQRWGDYDLNV